MMREVPCRLSLFLCSLNDKTMLKLEEVLNDALMLGEFDCGVCPGPNSRSITGETPLHLMAYLGDYNALEVLLDAGADINAKDDAGRTALHVAVMQRQFLSVRCLIKCGADISLKTADGQTARMLAETGNCPAVLDEL